MTSSMMRPGNFRHDMRGKGVVEVSMAEYLRSKRSILKKIRRRLVILGVFIGLTAFVSLVLGTVINVSHDKVTKYHRKFVNVPLRDLYFVYGGVAMLFSFHGFYIDGHWDSMQKDGNQLVMHLRAYSLLGLVSSIGAIWLGYGTLTAFGLIELRYIVESPINIIYLVTLITLCIHLIVMPWLLRTVHRKANQADEYFSAEFMDSTRRSQRSGGSRGRNSDELEDERVDHEEDDEDEVELEIDEDNDDEEDEVRDRQAVVVPASSPRSRRPKQEPTRSPSKGRHAFYGADGSSRVSGPVVSARTSARSPRLSGRNHQQRMGSPRFKPSTPDIHATDDVHSSYPPVVLTDDFASASSVTKTDQIPFASPVFWTDPTPRLQLVDFWRLWKASETTGSFSCPFNCEPRREDVEAHLRTNGFHIAATEAKDNVLQVYFHAFQMGTDVFFLGEFVFLFSRRFFQATFKCKDHDLAPEFVTRFNLQDLQVLEE